MESKYIHISGKFVDFSFNGSNLNTCFEKPYLHYSRTWYKPWTWFRDPDIILPEPVEIILDIDVQKEKILFVAMNDCLGEVIKEHRRVFLTVDELRMLRKLKKVFLARMEGNEIAFDSLVIHLQEMDFEDVRENADYHARLIFSILELDKPLKASE